MAFINGQQDNINNNNNIDQIKQFTAELDKATAAQRAADLEAEEELLGVRLKNLSKAQQTKLIQLGQMLELEEKGIRELAKLRLTLSNQQFAVRKKEIQKEFQAYKAAAEEFLKLENKQKTSKAANTSKKQSSTANDLKASASTKQTDAAIQKASRKVQNAIYGVDKLSQDINDAIATLQETTQEASASKKGIKSATESQSSQINATNKQTSTVSVGAEAQKERQYADDKRLSREDKVELDKNTVESVRKSFEGLLKIKTKEQPKDAGLLNATIKEDLDKITADGSNASQTSLNIADDLIEQINAANKAEAALNEFNANKELNYRLLLAEKEHKLREEHAKEERRLADEQAKMEAQIAWNKAHADEIRAQEELAIKRGYLDEYQQLQKDGFSNLTKNMSAEEYAALRAREDRIEKTAAAQHKAAMASEKALDTLRRKDLTNKQKKELLEAQVQKRVAEKDWSGTKYEITDDMSDEEKAEIQKKRENAVKAEMAVNAAMGALANFAQKLNQQTDKIGAKQSPIDTRLQGSTANDTILGSYWKQLARDMNKIGAVNPYFTQEAFANNIEALVTKGISFDIKQRAFLMTIQEKIANTFEVADGTLLRLVRIQQQDTTAGRLGMESALNSFLNSMYETSEYLSDVADSVRGSLEEMQALMEGAAGTELEFQIQKWMGSLYSVGMSREAVQSIAQTFGQIASGDVGGLTGSGTGNLLIMAANEAGKSIADILQEGLNADETNELMQAMVNYLAQLAKESSDSRVVQQQLANVFGMKASDLRAATNLASSVKEVSNQDLTYSGMLGQLNKMANSMILRTSTGEMLTNIWDNVQYTMATQMSNDPILYLLPRVATLLEDYAGGIDLPFLNVMGFGVDLNTSVAQLMNVAAMSGSILGALGPMISGLASATSGSIMLNLAGINTSGKAPVIARGSAQTLQHLGGTSISESGYVGNASGDDVKNATLQDAEDSKNKQLVEAKDEESAVDTATRADLAVINIYNLLEEVAHGSQSLRVKVVGEVATVAGTSGGNPANSGSDNGNWVLTI